MIVQYQSHQVFCSECQKNDHYIASSQSWTEIVKLAMRHRRLRGHNPLITSEIHNLVNSFDFQEVPLVPSSNSTRTSKATPVSFILATPVEKGPKGRVPSSKPTKPTNPKKGLLDV